MRKVDGYVFIPRFNNQGIIWEPLFGPNIGGNGNFPYDNLENNGLTPFEKYCDAISQARIYLENMSCDDIGFGRVRMIIAESQEDAEQFRRKSNLIVIMKSGKHQGDGLLGPLVEGKPGFGAIPGGFLPATDFETYTFKTSLEATPFERAIYLSSEVHRQAECGATIAKFNLKRFKKRLTRQ